MKNTIEFVGCYWIDCLEVYVFPLQVFIEICIQTYLLTSYLEKVKGGIIHCGNTIKSKCGFTHIYIF